MLDGLRELLLEHLEDGHRDVVVIVGNGAVGGGEVRQVRVQRVGDVGHAGRFDERFLGRVVQGEAADQGEVVLDLGGGGVGHRSGVVATVLGVELDHAPVHPADAVDVVEVGLGAVLGPFEQTRQRRRQVVDLSHRHRRAGDPDGLAPRWQRGGARARRRGGGGGRGSRRGRRAGARHQGDRRHHHHQPAPGGARPGPVRRPGGHRSEASHGVHNSPSGLSCHRFLPAVRQLVTWSVRDHVGRRRCESCQGGVPGKTGSRFRRMRDEGAVRHHERPNRSSERGSYPMKFTIRSLVPADRCRRLRRRMLTGAVLAGSIVGVSVTAATTA